MRLCEDERFSDDGRVRVLGVLDVLLEEEREVRELACEELLEFLEVERVCLVPSRCRAGVGALFLSLGCDRELEAPLLLARSLASSGFLAER